MEVVEFEAEDVIATSGCGSDCTDNTGKISMEWLLISAKQT